MSFTIDEKGVALTETRDGVTMPADYSFSTINDFVHRHDTQFEDMQYLCLGMATHIEELQRREISANPINVTLNSVPVDRV